MSKMTIKEVLRALADGKIVKAECDSLVYYIKVQDGTVYHSSTAYHSSFTDSGGYTGFSFKADYTYSIFEPPKPKRRYWQWKLNADGQWWRHTYYLDDKGFYTDGTGYFESGEWDKMEKIKIEEDFIEV